MHNNRMNEIEKTAKLVILIVLLLSVHEPWQKVLILTMLYYFFLRQL